MRIFKNGWFSRFAEREAISDEELKTAAADIENGRFDADLGGRVYKQRLARSGGGKSSGYRVIVFFKSGARTFFVYGFAKSDRDNISKAELRSLKAEAKDSFALTESHIEALLKSGTYKEIV
ncbi:MAG: type II toxin-antitoxin system RelE/ParE family toxin [Treponema sp.]|jgi:hypothetical protein|nr:type II toxin-antitoxin system RelE/ParE family toxin [Treponema sp.]